MNKTLLLIETSLSGRNGRSTALAETYAARWLERTPGGRLVRRDLAANPVPHLSAERFAALASKPATRTPAQQAIIDEADALLDEVLAAEEVVFAIPMHNFGVPSTLRSYFDHLARNGVTFRYTAEGPQGLVTGRRAIVFAARGGIHAQPTDVAYVRQFLAFIGITDLDVVIAEGLDIDAETRERSLANARESIARLLPDAVAA